MSFSKVFYGCYPSLKCHLSREVKLKLRAAFHSISGKRGSSTPVEEKKNILRALTKIVGQKILGKGFSTKEFQIAEQIRWEILALRCKFGR